MAVNSSRSYLLHRGFVLENATLEFYICALLSVMFVSFLHPQRQAFLLCIMAFCALLLPEA